MHTYIYRYILKISRFFSASHDVCLPSDTYAPPFIYLWVSLSLDNFLICSTATSLNPTESKGDCSTTVRVREWRVLVCLSAWYIVLVLEEERRMIPTSTVSDVFPHHHLILYYSRVVYESLQWRPCKGKGSLYQRWQSSISPHGRLQLSKPSFRQLSCPQILPLRCTPTQPASLPAWERQSRRARKVLDPAPLPLMQQLRFSRWRRGTWRFLPNPPRF